MRRTIRPTLAAGLFALLIALSPHSAGACVDYLDHLHRSLLAEYPDMTIDDGVRVDDVLVVAADDLGVARIALAGDGPGDLIDRLVLAGGAHRVDAADRMIYAVDEQGLLTIVRVDQPDAYEIQATLDLGSRPWDVTVAGDLLLVATDQDGLAVVDVGNPVSPWVRSTLTGPMARDAIVVGDVAWVAHHGGLWVVDLADPDAPQILDTIPTEYGLIDLAHDGTRLAAADGDVVRLFDVRDPAAPVLADVLDAPLHGLTLSGRHVAGTRHNEFLVYDPAAPPASRLIGHLTSEFTSRGVLPLDGGKVLKLVVWGAEVYDLANPAAVAPERLELDTWIVHADADGDLVAAIDHDEDLRLFRRTGPGQLDELGRLHIDDSQLYAVALHGSRAYVGGRLGLAAVDVSDPTAPVLVWETYLAQFHRRLAVQDGCLAVCTSAALVFVDISDPDAPELGQFLPIGAADAALRGDRCYAALDDEGVGVVDIGDLHDARVIATVPANADTRAIAVGEGLLATIDEEWSMSVFGLADPDSPQLLGSTRTSGNNQARVTLRGQTAYAVTSDGGFQVFDLTSPTAPRRVGSFHDGRGVASAAAGGVLTMAEGLGLRLYPLHCDGVVSLEDPDEDQAGEPDDEPEAATASSGGLAIVGVAPNPANPRAVVTVQLDRAATLRCRVLDLRGRHVATLADGPRDPGVHAIRWDGRDRRGRDAGAGAYLVEVRTPGATRAARLTIVR